VTWTKNDCEGYFTNLFSGERSEPDDKRVGCVDDQGNGGAGSIKIGGTTTLKDTTIDVTFVELASSTASATAAPTV
jgi:hypothetical protein